MKTFLLAAAVAALSHAAAAQITMAPASPPAKLDQMVGMANATIEYARPSANGRAIFGGLITHGNIWRTGANASTKLSFDRDVKFGGEDVPAGTYALYTIPDARSWTVILSTNLNLWGAGGYSDEQDLLRVEAPVVKLKDRVESFTIDFQNFHMSGADLVLSWDDTRIAVPVVVDSDAEIFAQIDEKVVNASGEVSAQDYFSAAVFYHQKGRDLETAAKWMDTAVAAQPQAFWMVLARAELAYDMGDMEAAKRGAMSAREIAGQSPQGDFGYIAKSNLLLTKIEAGAEGGASGRRRG